MNNFGLSAGVRTGRANGAGTGVFKLYPRFDARNIPRKAMYIGPLNDAQNPDPWELVTLPSTSIWVAAAQSGTSGRIVMVANGGQSAYSDDGGKTWTAGGALPAGTWNKVMWGNGVFVALNNDNANNGAATTTDGVTWTTRALAAGTYRDLIYGGGLFVAFVGSGGGNLYSSTDGITWTLKTPTTGNMLGYHPGAALYISSGNASTTINTSPDLVTWTPRANSMDGSTPFGIAYGNGKICIYSFRSNAPCGSISESYDAINWGPIAGTLEETMPNGPNPSGYCLHFGNGMFFALTNAGLQMSRDAHKWSSTYPYPSSVGGTSNFRFLVPLANGRVLLIGYKGTTTSVNFAFLTDANVQDLYFVP